MAKILKFFSVLAAGGILLIVLALAAFNYLIQVGEFRRILIREVENRTGLSLRAGEARFHVGWALGVSIDDVALSRTPNAAPALVAESILIRFALMPLLERRIAIDGILFHRPQVRMQRTTGEAAGTPPLVEVLTILARADFREIGIAGGEIVFRDSQGNGKVLVTYFHDMDLRLSRTEAAAVSAVASAPGAPAFAYAVSATVERGSRRAGFAMEGEVVFPARGFELEDAWLDTRIAVESFPAAIMHDYVAASRAMDGVLSTRVRWQGKLAEGVRVKGDVDFQRLKINRLDLLPRGLELGSGTLGLDVEFTGGEFHLHGFDLRSDEVSVGVEGLVESITTADPRLDVKVSTPFLTHKAIRRLLPAKVFSSPPWGPWLDGIEAGELKVTQARLNGRLSELGKLTGPGSESRLSLRGEIRGVQWKLPEDRLLPLRDLSGRFSLEKGVFNFSRFAGFYGQATLDDMEGKVGLDIGRAPLEMRIRGESELTVLWEQVRLHALPAHAADSVGRVGPIKGKAKFVAYLRADFKGPAQYRGQVLFDNTEARIGVVSLTKIHGHLSFSPLELRTGGLTFQVEDSPLRVAGALTDYRSNSPTLDLTLDSTGVKAGALAAMFLSAASPKDPGIIRGRVRYRGTLAAGGKTSLNGALDLAGITLPLRLFKEPIGDVYGQLKFEPDGIDLSGFKGRVAGYGFDFSGRWVYGNAPRLRFSSSAVEMDFTGLLPRPKAQKPPSPAMERFYSRLQVEGKVRIHHGKYRGFRFTDLSTDVSLNRRRWLFDHFSAKSGGGNIEGDAAFMDQPGGLSFTVKPKIQKVAVGEVLGFFGKGAEDLTGKVDLAGVFESEGKDVQERKKKLRGSFKIDAEDGVIRRMALLVRILSLMDLSRWFTLKMPDFSQEGIQYKKISADFTILGGVYSTRNLVVDGDELRLSGAGEIDGAKGEMDLVIAMRPFPNLDAAVSHIPLIGRGLAGIKNSLLVASFRVRGPLDDPSITPAPISTLSEFLFGALSIPKDMIGIPGAGEP